MSTNLSTFQALRTHLQTYPAPVRPPSKPHEPSLSNAIATLQLHPTLEVALHLLNADLPSAHFLARHMQGPPAHEGMFLHGILHRIEGDYDNARAWYEAVRETDVFGAVWRDWDEAGAFIARIEALVKAGEGVEAKLEGESRREVEGVLGFCERKFGTGTWADASEAWAKAPEEIRQMGEDMVTGSKGRRQF